MFQKFSDQINPHVSVDCVILGFYEGELYALLIERSAGEEDIDDDTLVLPGDLIRENEDLDMAAQRVLKGLVGLENIYLQQLKAFGSMDRLSKEKDRAWLEAVRLDPNAQVITVGYFALINKQDYQLTPSGFANRATWVRLQDVTELGFDHNEILNEAVERLRYDLFHKPIGFELLPDEFTLHAIQSLYETILDVELDKRNFRRKILKSGFLVDTGKLQSGVPHKPAKLFRFNEKKFNKDQTQFTSFY